MQPLLRYNTEDDFNITVSEALEDVGKISEDELYEIYKQLRQENLIWQDCKPTNVGRLKRKNDIHFNRIEHIYGPNIGFPEDEKNEPEPLEAGEWVILDLDFIFSEDDLNNKKYEDINHSSSKYYESQYQKEMSRRRQQQQQWNMSELTELAMQKNAIEQVDNAMKKIKENITQGKEEKQSEK